MFLTRMSAFAIGTLNNFKTQWKAYLLFCSYFHLQPFQIDAELLNCKVELLNLLRVYVIILTGLKFCFYY